jgi:putative transposase
LKTEAAVLASIEYIHQNPVKRRLCQLPAQWRWSSARWYNSDKRETDSQLPRLQSLPPEFFETSTIGP